MGPSRVILSSGRRVLTCSVVCYASICNLFGNLAFGPVAVGSGGLCRRHLTHTRMLLRDCSQTGHELGRLGRTRRCCGTVLIPNARIHRSVCKVKAVIRGGDAGVVIDFRGNSRPGVFSCCFSVTSNRLGFTSSLSRGARRHCHALYGRRATICRTINRLRGRLRRCHSVVRWVTEGGKPFSQSIFSYLTVFFHRLFNRHPRPNTSIFKHGSFRLTTGTHRPTMRQLTSASKRVGIRTLILLQRRNQQDTRPLPRNTFRINYTTRNRTPFKTTMRTRILTRMNKRVRVDGLLPATTKRLRRPSTKRPIRPMITSTRQLLFILVNSRMVTTILPHRLP